MTRTRAQIVPGVVLAIADCLLINFSFAVAWYLRYELEVGREVAATDHLPLGDYLGIQILFTICLLGTFRLNGVYGRRRRQGWIDEVSGIFSGTLIATAVLIVWIFYLRPFGYSRLIFIYALFLTSLFLSVARAADRVWQGMLRRRGIGLRRALIVGGGSLGRMIIQNIVAQPELGYQIV
ncbi:MAG TPA: hypothetical protein VFZ25_08800, partial [Chloroflexota bacterium]|nr:hypothetical protein [Chloroflexota bacterium]